MKIKKHIFLLTFFPFFLNAQTGDLDFYLSGFADTYHAVRTANPYDFMSSRSRLRAELNISKDDAYMFVSMNAVYNNILPEQTGFQLREVFFQYTSDNWDFKAGRQIVTWGVADGIRVSDIISPMDYTEFLAQDYDDIRVPVNGLRVKYFNNTCNVDLIFLPVPEFFLLPVNANNPWSVFSSSSVHYELENENTPQKKLSNSEFGLRTSFFLRGIDISVSALHTWNKIPVLSKKFSPNQDTLFVSYQYDRMDMLGIDIACPYDEFVFRGEVAGYFNELQDANINISNDEKISKTSIVALIGIDWYPGNEWNITAQYNHKLITNYDDRIATDKNTCISTLGITKKLMSNTLTLSSFTYLDIKNEGMFSRNSIDYALTDQIHLMAGYDWFHGTKGSFGTYGDNSEIWMKAKFSF